MRTASPILIAISILTLSLASALLVIWFALTQPWLGLVLTDKAGNGIHVASVHKNGPATGKIEAGARLVEIRSLVNPTAWAVALAPHDRIEEPDTFPEPSMVSNFLARQDWISEILAKGPIIFEVVVSSDLVNESSPQAVILNPEQSRPLSDLPTVFWVQLAVGSIGLLLGGCVMALRRHDKPVQLFLLAGAGLMVSAHAAAFYSTRELALPIAQFTWFSWLNLTGTLLFGVGMINLFLVYPSRLAGPWILKAVAAFFMIPSLVALIGWPVFLLDRQRPIALAMLILLAVIITQVFLNRRNPTARAMLGWFGLSVLIGAGGFGLTITLPILLGGTPTLSQGYAFLFFLVIYVGLAMGVARYRLFDLSEWSFRIVFYIGGVVLLLTLDAALIFLISLDRIPALGLSLALVGLIYLPLRDAAGRWIRRDYDFTREELFALVTEVTLAPTTPERTSAINMLLKKIFDPMKIEQSPSVHSSARLIDGGESMVIPMPQGMLGAKLHWAKQGRRLFSRQDIRLANSITLMLDRAITRQRDHDQAVEKERSRINRDMHDNIGIQLLGALHSSDPDRKNRLIRQTLSDLRLIISSPMNEVAPLSGLIADLRSEVGEHLETAGLGLTWEDNGLAHPDSQKFECHPLLVQTLRALIREGVSNVLRHSGARHVRISLVPVGDSANEQNLTALRVIIEDDGTGPPKEWRSTGNGLANLKHRIKGCGGHFEIHTNHLGTKIEVTLPLNEDRLIQEADCTASNQCEF